MFSTEQADALEGIGSALVSLGESIQRLAAATPEVRGDDGDEEPTREATPSFDAMEVEALWRRLGRGNREFLIACVQAFAPGERFTLEEMADAVGASTGSVKARLMNVGRSLKSMGNDFTVLWDGEWGLVNMSYVWRPEAHAIIKSKAEA